MLKFGSREEFEQAREIVYAASLADFHAITGTELLSTLATDALLTGGCRRDDSLHGSVHEGALHVLGGHGKPADIRQALSFTTHRMRPLQLLKVPYACMNAMQISTERRNSSNG